MSKLLIRRIFLKCIILTTGIVIINPLQLARMIDQANRHAFYSIPPIPVLWPIEGQDYMLIQFYETLKRYHIPSIVKVFNKRR